MSKDVSLVLWGGAPPVLPQENVKFRDKKQILFKSTQQEFVKDTLVTSMVLCYLEKKNSKNSLPNMGFFFFFFAFIFLEVL